MTYRPPPIPVAPLAPLSYQQPERPRRPGIMTAVGILSIVIGALSGLSSVGGVFSGIAMIMMSRISSSMTFPAPPAPSTAPTVTVDGVEVDPAGSDDAMDETMRDKVLQACEQGRTLTAARRQNLDRLLQNSGKKLFPAMNENTTVDEVAGMMTFRAAGSSTDTINVPAGMIVLSDRAAIFRPTGQGEVVQATVSPPSAAPSTQIVAGGSLSLPTVTATKGARFPFRVNPLASALTIGESLLSGIAAAMLLLGGILLLRDSPRSRRLHWIFVAMKIPLACLAGVATWMTYTTMMTSMYSAMPGGASPPAMGVVTAVSAMFSVGMALAYPIALIVVLVSQTARTYFHSIRTGAQ